MYEAIIFCRSLLTKGKSGPLNGRDTHTHKTSSISLHVEPHLCHTQKRNPAGRSAALTLMMLLLRGMPGLPSRCCPQGNPFSLPLFSGLPGGADPGSSPAPASAQSPLETRPPALSKRTLPPPPPPSPSPALKATLPCSGPGEPGSPPPPPPPPNSAISRRAAAAQRRGPPPLCRSRCSAVPLLPLSGYLRAGGNQQKSLSAVHLAPRSRLSRRLVGGGRLAVVSASTSARSVSPSAPGKGKEAKRDGLLPHAAAAGGSVTPRHSHSLTHTRTHADGRRARTQPRTGRAQPPARAPPAPSRAEIGVFPLTPTSPSQPGAKKRERGENLSATPRTPPAAARRSPSRRRGGDPWGSGKSGHHQPPRWPPPATFLPSRRHPPLAALSPGNPLPARPRQPPSRAPGHRPPRPATHLGCEVTGGSPAAAAAPETLFPLSPPPRYGRRLCPEPDTERN